MKYQSGFISFRHQTVNGVRAQVKVETGTLPVKEITDAGSMKKVVFDISALGNVKLKRDPYANINPSEPAYVLCEAALATGEPVSFRVESQRKKSVKELRAPMSSLDAASQTVRCLVAVNDEVTGEAQTSPSEDGEWREVAQSEAPDFIDTASSPASGGMNPADAFSVFDRVVKARGADSDAAIAVAAVAAIFGVDVYNR